VGDLFLLAFLQGVGEDSVFVELELVGQDALDRLLLLFDLLSYVCVFLFLPVEGAEGDSVGLAQEGRHALVGERAVGQLLEFVELGVHDVLQSVSALLQGVQVRLHFGVVDREWVEVCEHVVEFDGRQVGQLDVVEDVGDFLRQQVFSGVLSREGELGLVELAHLFLRILPYAEKILGESVGLDGKEVAGLDIGADVVRFDVNN